MILVTGASGTVGSHVVQALQSAKSPFKAAFHSIEKAEAARKKGIDGVVLDYGRPETLRAALKGVDALFLLGPNAPNQADLERHVVEAAKGGGVKRIVKLSVWGAEGEAYSFARIHRAVEKAIEASGLAWTFLRPNGFMQNIVNYMGGTIKGEGKIYSAVGEAKMSHVDVRDIAAVAARALTASGHEKKAYTLSGPEALTYAEMAKELSGVLGRTITHVSLAPADYRGALVAAGTPEDYADRLLDLDRYYREGNASRVTGDVKQVTGREPIRFAQYARECAAVLR